MMTSLQKSSRLVFQRLNLQRTIIRPLQLLATPHTKVHTPHSTLNASLLALASPRSNSSNTSAEASVREPEQVLSSPNVSRKDVKEKGSWAHKKTFKEYAELPPFVQNALTAPPSPEMLQELPGLHELLNRKGRNKWYYVRLSKGKNTKAFQLWKPFQFPDFKATWVRSF